MISEIAITVKTYGNPKFGQGLYKLDDNCGMTI